MSNVTPKETNKFAIQGKTKVVNGTILMPETSGLRMVMTAATETGKPDGALYSLLDTKWKNAKAEFKGWYQQHVTFKLGNIHETAVQSDIWIVHCLFLDKEGKVNDKALASCLKKLGDKAKYEHGSVHVSTLLVKDVPTLPELLQTHLVEKGVSVYYYEEKLSEKTQ
jgi:hypothetical protein